MPTLLAAQRQLGDRLVFAKVRGLYSMLLGPEDALLALRINFQDGLTTDQIEQTIDQVTAAVKRAYPNVHHVVIEPES